MSLAELVITSVLVEGRSKTEVARDYRISRYPDPAVRGPTMSWHNAIVDQAMASYLERHGQAHRLRALPDAELTPRDEAMRVATPQYIVRWYAGEVEAGRIIPAQELPPIPQRRRLREAQGLSRPAVGELVGVSHDAIRLWELGEREPSDAQRARYRELLESSSSGPQQPAQKPAAPKPEPGAGPVPRADPQREPGSGAAREGAASSAASSLAAQVEVAVEGVPPGRPVPQ